jgi:hypothetical protein
MSKFKVKMVFPDGTESDTATFKDGNAVQCLSNSSVQAVVKHFLKQADKVQGIVIIWGNGKAESHNIISDTKIREQLEAVANGSKQ